MRGLPFRATDDEVVDFFSGYNMIPTSIKYKFDD
jgi:RNA recognition motif-containing protein